MKKSRQQELEELQEKVFGSQAPKRNVPTSMKEMMEQANALEKRTTSMFNDLSKVSQNVDNNLDMLEKSGQSLNDILEKNLKEIEEMNANISQNLSMEELNSFESQMNSDFKIKESEQSVLNTISNSLDTLESDLNEKIIGQQKAIKEISMALKRPFVFKNESLKCLNSLLVLGPKGSGKHEIINEIGHHLNMPIITIDLSKYSSQEDEKLFLQDIYSAVYQENSILLFENCESCFSGYLNYITQFFKTGSIELKKRYTQIKGQLQETNSNLVSNSISSINATSHYLILCSDLKKSKLIDVLGIEFMNSISDIIETESIDTTLDQWIQNYFDLCKEAVNKIVETDFDESCKEYFKTKYIPSNGTYSLEDIKKEIIQAVTQYKLENKEIEHIRIYFDSILKLDVNDASIDLLSVLVRENVFDLDEIKKELDEIVGLEDVKKYVLSLEDNYMIQKLREKQGLKNASISKHMIFTGNPGTGKTTIARLISKYLRAIGVLSGGQLIEVTRADLVGRYVGHTAPLTMQVIQSALGGVLFIDEAYSLYRGQDDSFGLECIDTIVKAIEDYRDNLIVILAGYKKEMDAFLESNSGLKSRFPNIIDFKDYTADELVQISYSTAKSKDYFINDECRDALYAYYDKIQKDDSKMSGNGRMARNKVEEAILNQGSRILKDPSQNIQELRLCDFQLDESSFVR